jgi:hypothetical protein
MVAELAARSARPLDVAYFIMSHGFIIHLSIFSLASGAWRPAQPPSLPSLPTSAVPRTDTSVALTYA